MEGSKGYETTIPPIFVPALDLREEADGMVQLKYGEFKFFVIFSWLNYNMTWFSDWVLESTTPALNLACDFYHKLDVRGPNVLHHVEALAKESRAIHS